MTKLPDYGEALRAALRSARPLKKTETVPLAAAHGRLLAESVTADRDLPPFDRAQMDGYAVRAAEVGHVDAFPLVGSVPAGRPADLAVPAGHCVAIATGAPVPADVDAVIPHELSDRGDPVRFTVMSIEPGNAIHPRGADARQGDAVIAAGTLLAPHHLGIAATVGRQALPVTSRPRVIILTSGDEVMPPGEPVAGHQIHNSNAPMIRALLERIGAAPIEHRHLVDDLSTTVNAVADALIHADLVLTVGGISVGDRDFVREALEDQDVSVSLRSAAIQPGRPILVGRAPSGAVTLGLPGNPVSALACTCLFGWPIVRVQLGLDASLPWRHVELAEPVKPNPRRRAFRPANLIDHDRVRVPAWAGSGDLAHTASTDGLLELPVQDDAVEAGTRLRFLAWP
jgi:molybdopterin molybdotransferase